MAEENEHTQKLVAARKRVVAERRSVAEALSQEYKRGHTERMRELFVGIQTTIEAIDRAIVHERSLASGKDPAIVPPVIITSRRTD